MTAEKRKATKDDIYSRGSLELYHDRIDKAHFEYHEKE